MKKIYSRILNTIAGRAFVPAMFSLVLLFPSATQAWTYNLATNLNPVVAANVCPGAVKVPIYGFSIAATAGGGTASLFNGFSFTTNPGYAAGSVQNFKLWRSNNNTNVFSTATILVQTLTPAGGPGLQTFPAAGWIATNLNAIGTTYYFWVTMDVAAAPTVGNTVTVSATAWANLTLTQAPTKTTGTITAGGTQTLVGIVTQPTTATMCIGSSTTLNITASPGPAWTYQWTLAGVPVVNGTPAGAVYTNQNTASMTISGLAVGTYNNYRCNLGGACTMTSNAASIVVSNLLTYTPLLNAFVNHGPTGYYVNYFDPNNITICFRDMIDFDNSGSPGVPVGGALTYQWNGVWAQNIPPIIYSNNLLLDQDSVYIKFTYTGTGCYNTPSYSNKMYFTVYPSDPPDAQGVTVTPPLPGPYCAGQNITFNATVGGQLGSSPIYKWLDNLVPIPAATGLSYTGTFTSGSHNVSFVVQSSDTCSSPPTDTIHVPISVGLCYDTMNAAGTTTISRCGGVFYDNGGPAANYTNANSTGLLTILPTSAGQYVTVTFTSFSSELNIDRLRIFSGTDTSGAFLGQLTGTGAACGTFTSAHASGGLTFKWITNGAVNAAGWVANLGCSPTPSVITPGMNCTNPINISVLPYSVAGQTNNCFSSSHVSGMGCAVSNVGGNDNFYRYVATGPECITIFIANATNNAISLNVYEGCPGAGGICRGTWTTATGGNLGGQVTLPNPGTYYFVVDANTGVTFNYNLSINTFGSAPLNDLPCNAEVLIQTVPHFDDNSCAGTESGGGVNNANCISGNINSLWYSFTTNPGQTQARIRFTRGLGTLPDLTVQVYGGSCSALTYITCSSHTMNGFWDCMSQPQTVFSVSPSTTYYIRVDGQANATGSYQITVDDPINAVPAYGYDCGNPISISSQTCTYGTPAFIGVGEQCDFPSSNSAGFFGERDGVWFLFQTVVPNANGVTQLTFDIHSDPSVTTDWDFLIINVTSQYPSNICSYINSGSWNTAPGMISSSWVDTWQAPANGHTGCRSTGTTHINGFPFNAPIPLAGTQWWMLYVSNFRFNQFPFGFTLEMGYSNSSTVANYNPQNSGAVVYNTSAPPQMIWWTGQANTTDWFNMANWGGCAVPSCSNNTSATIASVYSPGLPFPTINAAGAITKNLAIRPPAGSLTIAPAGQLDICGNWLFISTPTTFFTAQAGSTVRAISDLFQYFDGTMSANSAFSNFIMTKSLAPLRPLTLFNKAEVKGALTLTAGKIITNAKELYISNTTPTLFNAPNGNNNSYVQGNLRRAISSSGGSYDFPVGISSSYQRANVNFTTATSIPTLLAHFTGTAVPIQPGPIGPECPNYDYSILAPLNNGYWTVDASANPTSGTYNMTLYNTGYSNAGPAAPATAWTVLKAATAAGPWVLNGTCAAVSTATVTTRDGMSGFSVFTSGQGTQVVLPVELLTLSATLEHTAVAVNWETATETNNHHFDVERSHDGEHFEKIGEKTGAGNSTVNLYYNLIDENPYEGINYYRLKQVDFDGAYEYSDKVFVTVRPDAGLVSVFSDKEPTEISCELNSDGSGSIEIQILDVLGKVHSTYVREVKAGYNKLDDFSVENLSQGVYFMKVRALESEIVPASQIKFVIPLPSDTRVLHPSQK